MVPGNEGERSPDRARSPSFPGTHSANAHTVGAKGPERLPSHCTGRELADTVVVGRPILRTRRRPGPNLGCWKSTPSPTCLGAILTGLMPVATLVNGINYEELEGRMPRVESQLEP